MRCIWSFVCLATLVLSLATLEGDESFEASQLGSTEEVVQERVGDDELILVNGTKARSAASIILRSVRSLPFDSIF